MASARSRFAPWLFALLLAACGDSRGTTFVDGDASTPPPDTTPPPDATGTTCTSNAQCDDSVACTHDVCVVGGTCEHIPDGPSCMPAQHCARAADCDDSVACTRDTCLVDGTCSHVPQVDMCPTGQTCDMTRGCSAGSTGSCRTDADCRDAFDCTVETCGADGHCVYTAQNSRCTTAGQVCRVGMGCVSERACSSDANCDDNMRCNGVEHCTEGGCVSGMAVSCDDMMPCTMDACSETGAMCTHTMDATCMGGGNPRSGRYTLMPGVTYSCVDSVFGMTVVDIHLTFVQITVAATGITVVGGPTMMTGGPITGGMFSARGTVAGSCQEIYTLAGTFSDDRHFTGMFTTMYVGADCGFTDCMSRSFTVMGTLST